MRGTNERGRIRLGADVKTEVGRVGHPHLGLTKINQKKPYTHIFSHLRHEVTVWRCETEEEELKQGFWASSEDLLATQQGVGITVSMHKALKLVLGEGKVVKKNAVKNRKVLESVKQEDEQEDMCLMSRDTITKGSTKRAKIEVIDLT